MTDETPIGLPPSIELAWGARTPPNRGPKRGLSLQQIVAAAVEVADTDGLDAVSMKRVAAELDAGTMALYRYVGAKDELLMLMVDAAYGEPPDIPAPHHDWRAGLTHWARHFLERCHLHPWSVHVPIAGPPVTPNTVAWMEQALRYLEATPLPAYERMSGLLLISGYIRNQALTEIELGSAAERAGTTVGTMSAGYGALLAGLASRDRFPALHTVIDSGVLDDSDDDLDEEFAFGLERILDGLAAHIESSS